MTHEIIKELEAKLFEMRQDRDALEQTIAYLKSLGYGKDKKETSPSPARDGAHKPITMIGKMKAAIQSLGPRTFTTYDIKPLIADAPFNIGTRLSQLAQTGYITRISKGSTRHPSVYERAKPASSTSQFSPTQKEKAAQALARNGPAKFICEGCGESFELCPQQCPKCSSRAFEELELGKEEAQSNA